MENEGQTPGKRKSVRSCRGDEGKGKEGGVN